jgi:LemA protein
VGIFVILLVSAVILSSAARVCYRIVQFENRLQNFLSQIDSQLRLRDGIIPHLIEMIKDYAAHEGEALEVIRNSRQLTITQGSVAESARRANLLRGALGRMIALGEEYPEIRGQERFKLLREELAIADKNIASTRQLYNDLVLKYNIAIDTVPGSLFAKLMGKTERVYFEISETLQ